MISLHQVQLREDGSAMEAGGQVLEVRKRITIESRGKIKMAVVAASPPGTVRLEDKMKGGRPGAIGAGDYTGRFQFVKVRFCLLKTRGVQMMSFGKNWWPSGVNMVLNTRMGRKIF